MKRKRFPIAVIVLWLLAMMWASPGVARGGTGERDEKLIERAMKVRVPFVANQGQIEDRAIRFYAGVSGGTVFVTDTGELIYSLRIAQEDRTATDIEGSLGIKITGGERSRKELVLKEGLLGAACRGPEGIEQSPAHITYFVGADRTRWKSGLPAFNALEFGEVYDGIELRLKAYRNTVEKVFIVKPGAVVETIAVKIEGIQGLRVNDEGELELATGYGAVRFTKPVAYQMKDGHRQSVAVAYRTEGDIYGFKVGDYDPSRSLIIDPSLASTLLGGAGSEDAHCLAIDSQGNIFVSGSTSSRDFPVTPDAYDSTYQGGSSTYDVFVSKFDPDLTRLLASTYIGGTLGDAALSIAIDRFDNVYVTGWTQSSDFPVTPGAYDTTFGGNADVFISKLDSNLTTLLASTFLGGKEIEMVSSLVLSGSGEAYVAGYTRSDDYPSTPGAYRTTPGETYFSTGFVSMLSSDLTTLLSSTFVPGPISETGLFIAVGDQGEVFAAGGTSRADFPITPGAFDTTHNGEADVFVMKFDPALGALLASTLIGGFSYENPTSLAIDGSGNTLIGGMTSSPNFPTTPDAYQSSLFYYGGSIGFVSKLNPSLSTLLASTYAGDGLTGSGGIKSLALDSWGNVLIAGETQSKDFFTTGQAYDLTFNGSTDIFVSKFDPNLGQLLASTYIGGSGYDQGGALAVSATGDVYVVGRTSSQDFPVPEGAYSRELKWVDAFILRFSGDLSVPGGNPEMKVTPVSIDFGTVSVGTPALVKTITVSNASGAADLQVYSANLTGDRPFDFYFYRDTCSGRTLKPSEKCLIQIGSNPGSSGSTSAVLTLVSNDLDRPLLYLSLRGNGEISDIVLIPSSISFGEILLGDFSDQILFISNNGPGLLVLGEIKEPSFPFGKVIDHCSDHILVPDERCPVLIRFAPSLSGAFSSSLIVPSSDPDEGELSVPLIGVGVINEINVEPREVDFGIFPVGSVSDHPVLVKNVGAGPLTLEEFGSLSPPFSRARGTCREGEVLLSGQSCDLILRFSPVTPGSFSSDFAIRSNDLDEPVVTVGLKGGAGPDLTGKWLSVTEFCRGAGSGEKCKIAAVFETANAGSQDASSSVTFYFSEDSNFDSGDLFLKKVGTGRIKAGMSKVKKWSSGMPPGTGSSGKYVIAVIDEENAVTESDEGNNIVIFLMP